MATNLEGWCGRQPDRRWGQCVGGTAGGDGAARRRGHRRSWAAVGAGDSRVGAVMDLSLGTKLVNGGRRKESEDHVWFEDLWMVTSLCDE
jgi:hypothetical protein